MSRRYTIILVLAAVLLTGFSLSLSRRDSRDWRANRSRRIFPFPWQDAATIKIAKPGAEELFFTRKPGGEWMVKIDDELFDALNPAAADDLAAFATLSWREAQKGRNPPAPESAVVLTATNHAGQSVKLTFGDTADNLRSTVIDDDGATVYGVNQDLLGFLDWPAQRFRNMYLATAGVGRKPHKILVAPDPKDPSLTLALELGPRGWNLTEPVGWPVDESRLDILIRWLDRLRGESIIAEMSGDLEWFGFGPDSPRIEAWYAGPAGEIHRRVEFGKVEDGKVFAREVGRNPIFAVPQEYLTEISMDIAKDHPASWRNFYRLRALNSIGETLPESICIERLLPTPQKLTLEQYRDQTVVKWRGRLETADGVRVFPVDPPDGEDPMRPLTALVTGLSSLRVKAFLAETDPGAETIQWTAYPAWRFSFTSPGKTEPSSLVLYAADAGGDFPAGQPYKENVAGPQEMQPKPDMPDKVGIAFSMGGISAVMETYSELAYLLCLPPYRYQSRRLLDLAPRLWDRVDIAIKGNERVFVRDSSEINEQWWLDGQPAQPLMDDNNRFLALLLDLSQLRSDGFVADINGDIAEFGLDQPAITAIVYSSSAEAAGEGKSEKLFSLALGKEADADGNRYARLDDSGPVFLVPGRVAAALAEKYK